MIAKALHPATQRRRSLQPLWNALERWVGPELPGGVWLAVSGGPDSMALMESAARWPARTPDLRGVIAIDHGTRAAASAETDFVAARARALGFDARVVRVSAAKADEASLREARYEGIARVLRESQAQAVCTAHHRDDDAEGHLMDLFGWGGGRRGAAMPARSVRADRILLRPFVGLARSELHLALSHLGIRRWVQDPLDARRAGARAVVRLDVLPALQRFQPQIAPRLGRRAAEIAEQEQYFNSILHSTFERRDGGLWLPRRPPEQVARLRREIHEILRQTSDADPRRATSTIDRLLEAAGYRGGSPRSGLSFDLPGCRAVLAPDGMLFLSARTEHAGGAKNEVPQT